MEITCLNFKLKINGLVLCLSIGLFIVNDCQGYKENSAINSFLHRLANCAGGGYLCEFGHKVLTNKFQPKCIQSFQRCNGFKNCPDGDDEQGCRCNELPSVKFGRFQLAIPGNDTLGALANIHCQPGYVARGKSSIQCSAITSEWEFWFGFCEPIMCGRLPTTLGGRYEPISGNGEIGSVAGLRCDFAHFGIVAHMQCESDGQWKAIANRTCNNMIEDIRLADGTNSRNGRVEVLINGIWGTVCSDQFGETAAKVVCRMLGIPIDSATEISKIGGGKNLAIMWLDDVKCDGTELSLNDCTNRGLLINNCQASEAVGVSCE